MIRINVYTSFLLIALGLIGYFGTDRVSLTALIPALFGVIFLLTSLIAKKQSLYKYAISTSILFAFLGFLGTAKSFIKIFQSFSGGQLDNPFAAYSKTIMALICMIYIVIALKSFSKKSPKPQTTLNCEIN